MSGATGERLTFGVSLEGLSFGGVPLEGFRSLLRQNKQARMMRIGIVVKKAILNGFQKGDSESL